MTKPSDADLKKWYGILKATAKPEKRDAWEDEPDIHSPFTKPDPTKAAKGRVGVSMQRARFKPKKMDQRPKTK